MKKITITTILGLMGALVSTSLYALDGPVPAGSLPGGATVVDTDPGFGEQWGRIGGRTLTFSAFELTGFDALQWGPTSATAVGIAFDGTISDPGELLSFSPGGSNLAAGVAVWTGSTTVPLAAGGSSFVSTRFTLTVKDAFNAPVSLIIDLATGQPHVDVKAASGQFSANLLMEARQGGSGAFTPALDLFDTLDTPEGGIQLAQTSLSTGFFFDAIDDLSVTAHDANMQQKTTDIANLLTFHNTETLGNIGDLKTDHTNLELEHSNIINKLMDVATLLESLNGEDIDQLRQSFEEFKTILFEFLWGIEFDENGEPIFESITRISELAKTKIDLQVVQPPNGNGSTKTRMFVLATENGEMVDAEIQVVAAIPADPSIPYEIVSFEAVNIADGLIRLDLNLTGPANSVKTFLILAEHSGHDFGDTVHKGAILVAE